MSRAAAPLSRPDSSIQAFAELNTALAINPNVPNAFYWRGQVYRRKGDIEHAIEEFSRAIAQAPQAERGSYFARGQLFIAKGEYARAIADFDRLLSFLPGNKEVQQQRQTAIAAQAELARVAPSKPAATGPGTVTVVPVRPVPGAVTVLPVRPAAPAAPSPSQQIDQAKQFINQGNYAAAVERLNQMLAGDPGNEMALRLRALSYERLGRLAEARNDLDDLLRLKPDDPPLLALRGITLAGPEAVRSGNGRRQSRDLARPE